MKERIQKILSSEGIASRRQAENLIREGRIKVNGLEAILGMSISRHDLIEIDGKKIEISEGKKALRVLMYNKKIGEISSRNKRHHNILPSDSSPLHRDHILLAKTIFLHQLFYL